MNSDVTNNLTFEGSKLIIRFRGVETKELRKLATVLCILVNTEFDILSEGLVELREVILVFRNFGDEVHRLFHEILADDLENFVLLECLTGDIERQIFRINDTLNEVEILGNEILAVIHDEHTADIKLDVVALLLGLEKIERSTREEMNFK